MLTATAPDTMAQLLDCLIRFHVDADTAFESEVQALLKRKLVAYGEDREVPTFDIFASCDSEETLATVLEHGRIDYRCLTAKPFRYERAPGHLVVQWECSWNPRG